MKNPDTRHETRDAIQCAIFFVSRVPRLESRKR